MKRLTALFLALALFLCLIPAASADYDDYALYGSTSLYGVSESGLHNIELAMSSLCGLTLDPGEYFSFNQLIGPRTREAGYKTALNGRGVRVVGGGVAQVASTIYLAALQSEDISFDQVSVYGSRYDGDYVDSGDLAIVTDYNSGTDFSFWNDTGCTLFIDLWIDPENEELCCELSLLNDNAPIAWSETPLYGSDGKIANVEQACWAISGITLRSYDVFSFNSLVGPRTAENGYKKAPNGRGVTVYGGGVAQVASTVYLAVKELDCVEILEKSTYGERFVDGYVDDVDDAIVTDYNAGTDFSFFYTGDEELVVELYPGEDTLYCWIYEYEAYDDEYYD